jgi:hypothetical protein
MLRPWRTNSPRRRGPKHDLGAARTVLVRLRLKWSRTLAEAVTDGGQAMKGLALLVDMSLLLALPTATTAEAWPTERWPMGDRCRRHRGFQSGYPADSRLMLQLGMLFALLYVAFLCAWLSPTRRRQALGQTTCSSTHCATARASAARSASTPPARTAAGASPSRAWARRSPSRIASASSSPTTAVAASAARAEPASV